MTEEKMNVIVCYFSHLAPVIYTVSHHLKTEWIKRLHSLPNATEWFTACRLFIQCIDSVLWPLFVQLVGMLDMSVPVVAKLRRLLDSLPKETLPDVLASMIRTSNKEKLQVQH